MRLYRVVQASGFIDSFHGTQEEAKAAAKALREESEALGLWSAEQLEAIRWEAVDIPTDKSGLLNWLRRNVA